MSQRFLPQHTEKCYCRTPISCLNSEKNIKSETGPKFIKMKNELGNSVPRADRVSSSLDFSPRSKSSVSNSLSKQSSVDSNLTIRRQLYEKSKQVSTDNDLTLYSNLSTTGLKQSSCLEHLNNEKINHLNRFRLQNPDDCFSLLSKHSIGMRLDKFETLEKPQQHVCEYRYQLDKRDLLEPSQKDNKDRPICVVCKKPSTELAASGVVPMARKGKNYNIVLDLKKTSDSIQYNKSRARGTCLPANSLALRYQAMT